MTISRKYVSTPERQPMTDWQRDRMHPATTHDDFRGPASEVSLRWVVGLAVFAVACVLVIAKGWHF